MAATLLLGDTSIGCLEGRLHREADLPIRYQAATGTRACHATTCQASPAFLRVSW